MLGNGKERQRQWQSPKALSSCLSPCPAEPQRHILKEPRVRGADGAHPWAGHGQVKGIIIQESM